jgi:hypothetical protein
MHFLRYLPLAERYASDRAQTAAASSQATQTSQALADLTQRKDAEIAQARAALEAEQARAQAAVTELEQARAQAAALQPQAEAPEAAAQEKPKARAAKRARKARAAKAPAKPSHMDRETNRALRAPVSDDPIAGID